MKLERGRRLVLAGRSWDREEPIHEGRGLVRGGRGFSPQRDLDPATGAFRPSCSYRREARDRSGAATGRRWVRRERGGKRDTAWAAWKMNLYTLFSVGEESAQSQGYLCKLHNTNREQAVHGEDKTGRPTTMYNLCVGSPSRKIDLIERACTTLASSRSASHIQIYTNYRPRPAGARTESHTRCCARFSYQVSAATTAVPWPSR
jgi:hypothetical protein